MNPFDNSFWEARYGEAAFAYGMEPNAFLRSLLPDLPPGRIWFPAEGEGRNAAYAAGLGWNVDAFDFSASGRDKALTLAAARKVTIHYEIADMTTVHPPPAHYDAVALIFVHQMPPVRRELHRKAVNALKPGGTLLLEAFAKEQAAFASGGPKDAQMLYSEEELRDDFSTLNLVSLHTLETELNEGAYHSGKAAVVRLLAYKPT